MGTGGENPAPRGDRGGLRSVRWLILLPALLLALASLNFFVFGDSEAQPSILVLPVLVGLILGGLFQIIERQKRELSAMNRAFEKKHRALEAQHKERLRVIERMRRFQGSAITALGSIHDIRNATTPILYATSTVEPTTPDDAETLKDISAAGQRINELTNRLLDTLQSGGATAAEARPAGKLIDETWQAVAALVPGLTPELVTAAGHLAVDVDDLKQIFHNLALNAQRAAGSSLKLMILGSVADGRYCIDIRDNGPGLPDRVVSRLGELHISQDDGEIHGLGLAIVSHLTARNHGRLHAETGPQGTTFRLCFPMG